MNSVVLLRMVPDVVEELEVAADGRGLDTEYLRMVLSESDDHALEQALMLKEKHGGTTTVVALDAPEVDEALYAALAKGADRAVKITAGGEGVATRQAAFWFAHAIETHPRLWPADLILTGVQAIDDLDGLVAPLVAHALHLSYLGIVTGVAVDAAAHSACVMKEFPAGVRGEFEVALPAVLGVQSAEKPPRYVPVAKIRAAMKSQKIEALAASPQADGGLPLVNVLRMSKVEAAGRAEMLEGAPEQVSDRLCGILAERALL